MTYVATNTFFLCITIIFSSTISEAIGASPYRPRATAEQGGEGRSRRDGTIFDEFTFDGAIILYIYMIK